MDIFEKAGDLVIDVAKLVIGTVLLGAIMMDKENPAILYVAGIFSVAILVVIGFLLYRVNNRKKK